MTVTLWLLYCLFASLAAAVAGVLHEATHAAAAHLVGGRVVDWGLDGWSLYVDWAAPHGIESWSVRSVQLAPAIVGWSVAGVWLARNGWPALSPWSVIGVVGWAVYTIGGGLEDYSVARAAASFNSRQRDRARDAEVPQHE